MKSKLIKTKSIERSLRFPSHETTHSEYLFFSDLHLHDRKEFSRIDPSTGLNVRLIEGLSVLDQIIDLCKHHKNVRGIFHLGDIFERKDNISNHVLIEFKKRLERFQSLGLPFYCLQGNHDFSLPDYPTLFIFDNIRFVKSPTITQSDDRIYLIPYQASWKQFETEWKRAHETDASIICFHQDIPGATYETGRSIVGEWTLKTDPKRLYLAGHIHRPQKIHGIQFLGSPYQVKFSDEGHRRYVWLVGDGRLTPVELNYSEFVSLRYELLSNEKPDQIEQRVKNNYVRVVGEVAREDWTATARTQLRETLEQLGAKVVVFQLRIKRPTPIDAPGRTMVKDDMEIIRDYATRNLVDGLELTKLIERGQSVYRSA